MTLEMIFVTMKIIPIVVEMIPMTVGGIFIVVEIAGMIVGIVPTVVGIVGTIIPGVSTIIGRVPTVIGIMGTIVPGVSIVIGIVPMITGMIPIVTGTGRIASRKPTFIFPILARQATAVENKTAPDESGAVRNVIQFIGQPISQDM